MKNINITDAEGNTTTLSDVDYKKAIIKEFKPKDFVHSENGDTTAKQVVDHVFKALTEGKDVDEEIKEKFADLVERVEADVNGSKDSAKNKAAEAAAAKAKKDEEKKAAEEAAKKKAEELAVVQTAFVGKVSEGVDLARSEFTEELLSIKDNLPEGVTISHKDGGYGIEFGEGATEETVGQLLGYVAQKAENNQFMGNQFNFWIGDIVSYTTEKGIYPTAKEAAQKICGLLKDNYGKELNIGNIDSYKRMAERTPLHLRNPMAQPTAYLKISDVKIPRKGDKETEEQYKERLSKFEEGREALQTKLASGEIKSRKDILPLVQEFEYEHGLKQRPDENAPTISLSQQFQIFFYTTFALENLVGTHKDHPEAAVYRKGEELYPVTKEELEEQRATAQAHLTNAFYKGKEVEVKDIIRGYKEVTKKVVVGKNAEGKNIEEDQVSESPVYPLPFWEVKETPKEESKEEASAE